MSAGTSRPERLRAALGGSPDGLREVARKLLLVAEAAERGALPATPTRLPFPFGECADVNAWAMGATSNLAHYLNALSGLAPLALPQPGKDSSNGS